MSEYLLPAFLAVLVHLGVLAAVAFAWMPASASKVLVKPAVIEASLVVLREEAPPKIAKPKRVSKPVKEAAAPAQAARPKPEVAAKPKPAMQPAAKPKADSGSDAKRAARERLAAESLELALATEVEAIERQRAARTAAELAQSYAARISRAIEQNWKRPPSARNGMRAVLMIDLVPTGEVVAVRIAESSGNEAFDRSAERAVERLGRLEVPDDPEIFERYFRHLRLEFQPEDLMR